VILGYKGPKRGKKKIKEEQKEKKEIKEEQKVQMSYLNDPLVA
jgi:hypothetical protein